MEIHRDSPFFNLFLLSCQGHQLPSSWQVWHLITDCHLCVGSTPTLSSENTKDLSQDDPGC